MELTSIMQALSFAQKPRDGQRSVIEAALNGGKNSLNVQLPTGYGKTFTACATYSVLRHIGKVNRLLYITTSKAQHQQFINTSKSNFEKCGLTGPMRIIDAGERGYSAIKENRNNTCQVFALTIQMISNSGWETVKELLEQGQWMIVVDEYHHYGIEATWGRRILELNYAFRLAMSATPSRKNGDSAFGKPDISIQYKDAVKENAVKPLLGHSYTYRIDAINENGDIISYTTSELAEELGEGEKLEKARIERKMRWSPRYISPLVTIPIERMMKNQLQTGLRLQAVVGAMCVSHAEMVCEQIRAMFSDLKVEWVGTGENGRSDKENAAIIEKFAPTDDEKKGFHEIDVLVHVGMAGEGLDSTHVSEVIHLNNAAINNSNNQENGRAARFLMDKRTGEPVIGNINFDSCSDYAKKGFVGKAIMDAFSEEVAQPCSDCGQLPCICETAEREDDWESFELPEEPVIILADMELIDIDSGSPDFKRMQKLLTEHPAYKNIGMTKENMNTPENIALTLQHFREMRKFEASEFNEESEIRQLQEAVNKAAGHLAHYVLRKTYGNTGSVPKTAIGDIKRAINSKKKQACGVIQPDKAVCMKHWTWLKNFEASIKQNGVPSWLA